MGGAPPPAAAPAVGALLVPPAPVPAAVVGACAIPAVPVPVGVVGARLPAAADVPAFGPVLEPAVPGVAGAVVPALVVVLSVEEDGPALPPPQAATNKQLKSRPGRGFIRDLSRSIGPLPPSKTLLAYHARRYDTSPGHRTPRTPRIAPRTDANDRTELRATQRIGGSAKNQHKGHVLAEMTTHGARRRSPAIHDNYRWS